MSDCFPSDLIENETAQTHFLWFISYRNDETFKSEKKERRKLKNFQFIIFLLNR